MLDLHAVLIVGSGVDRGDIGVAVDNHLDGAGQVGGGVAVEARLGELAATYPDPDAILKAYRQNPDAMRQVEGMVLEDQVVDYLLERATVTDQPSTFKELMNFGA